MKLSGVIFDMDGLIINSEPLWRKAEIAIFREVSVFLTDTDCASTAGLRIDEVVAHWYQQFPWDAPSPQEIEQRIVSHMVELITTEGKALPGIPSIFDFFLAQKLPMAIASSSHYRLINAVVDRLNIRPYFDVIYSAEDEQYGKPHPGTFITTAQKMNISPTECLVFEDSFHGVVAGLSARMKVVAIPENLQPKFEAAHLVLNSLEEFGKEQLKQLFPE